MASGDLRDEVTYCNCTDIYTDPITLPCGHSYCRLCIVNVLDTQEGSGGFKSPKYIVEFQERPALEKNRKQEKVLCTYCIHSPVPAAKSCVTCEASLCENHLRIHSKSTEHVLTEPTTSLKNRKCSVHKKVLEYYCCDDAACICVSCSLAGEHRGHQVETLNKASEKKKKKLRNVLQKLTSEREEAEKRVQSLQKLKRQVQGKTVGVIEQVTALITDIREQLEVLEKRVLSEIFRQEDQVSDLIRQLELKKEDLSRKMGHIEELCNVTDPLTVLQGRESDRADYCDDEEGDNEATERHDIEVHDVGDLDVGLISVTLHLGLVGIVTGLRRRSHVLEASHMLPGVNTASDILLDVNTAGNDLSVSGDLKTVSWSGINLRRPETSERFQYNQVLSSRSFSSGRHYWEVEGSESGLWEVGVTYPSIARRGDQSLMGNNNESWCLRRWFNCHYAVIHDCELMKLTLHASCRRLGIFLDYEAGRLSFYELCDPIRHIHTFTAAFTEPLHAVFGVYRDSWVRVV